jgi:hypothetical protein
MRRLSIWFGTALLVLALPRTAAAGNGLHPRTPVDWSGAPCMTIIDRTQGSIFPLVYGIPYEDTDVTPDEVDNSRTHQFFGFCRDHHLEEILPGWITEADLADADAHGLGDATGVDVELDVLENAPDWAGCWTRINADAERRPITFEAAAEPVPWDTTALPAGTWVVEGYTYEPWSNEWWPHPGVFKIIDDPDPAANGPAAALNFDEQTVEFGSQTTISGCLDAMDGSVLTASWALSGFGSEPQWQVFADSVATPSGEFQLPFEPPLETISNTVLIKIDVEDPMGRTWTAHAIRYIAVTEDVGGDEACDEGGGFVSDPCDTETGGSEGDPTDGGTTIGPPAQGDEGGSCSCSTRAGFGTGLLAWGVGLLLLGFSSRRRS